MKRIILYSERPEFEPQIIEEQFYPVCQEVQWWDHFVGGSGHDTLYLNVDNIFLEDSLFKEYPYHAREKGILSLHWNGPPNKILDKVITDLKIPPHMYWDHVERWT